MVEKGKVHFWWKRVPPKIPSLYYIMISNSCSIRCRIPGLVRCSKLPVDLLRNFIPLKIFNTAFNKMFVRCNHHSVYYVCPVPKAFGYFKRRPLTVSVPAAVSKVRRARMSAI